MIHPRISQSIVLLTVASFCLRVTGAPVRFEVKDAGLRNLVYFVSDAPLEKTVASSNFLTGWLELDPVDLDKGVKGELEVDTRTFETGSPSRNDRLRAVFFAAADFPTILFRVEGFAEVSTKKLTWNAPVSVRATGKLRVRGIEHQEIFLVKFTLLKESPTTRLRMPGNLLKVAANFDFALAQYGIQVPPTLKHQVASHLQVYVDFVGSDRLPDPNP